MSGEREPFERAFPRIAARIRAKLVTRHVLLAAGVALALGSLALVTAARAVGRRASWPLVGVVALAGGAGVGLVRGRKRAWSNQDVALYLDRKLGADEAIVTAFELPTSTAKEHAEDALARAPRAALDVPFLVRTHAIVPAAVLAFVLAARVEARVVAAPPALPGDERLTLAHVAGLERVEKLAMLPGRDEAQRERLAAIAKDAKRLREDLAKGLEKREAQDRAARLGEAIHNERISLGAGEERKGLESAIARLEREAATREAARALGDHDLESMDRELERRANARESEDRERAKRALEEAERAAKESGASGVGKALADQKKQLERRAKRADTLRELARAMGNDPSVSKQLDALDSNPSDANAEALAGALADALGKLSPEERSAIAKKLRDGKGAKGRQLSPEELDKLAERAASPEGAKELERMLRDLANQDDETDESRRDDALNDAEQGADDAERDLSGESPGGAAKSGDAGAGSSGGSGSGQTPGAAAGLGRGRGGGSGSGSGSGTGAGAGAGSGQAGNGSGGAGGGHDTGTGDHRGATPEVAGGTLKSRARGPMNRAELMPGTTTTWKPGQAGGTADVLGTGAVGRAGPAEVEGAERSDVPQEYREQVHKYFRP